MKSFIVSIVIAITIMFLIPQLHAQADSDEGNWKTWFITSGQS